MKKWLLPLLLSVAVIALVIMFGFQTLFKHDKLIHDDEQEGLKDQVVLKFSHVVAENTPKGLAAKKFADLVYKKSGGTIRVEVFPNGMLYSDIEEINALKEGKVQMIAPSTSKLGSLSKQWGVLDLPFAFPSYDAVQAGLSGPIGKQLLNSLAKNKLKGLAFWTNGFKQLTSNKGPILTPDDMEGQTFRIMQSDVIEAQFELLHTHTVRQSFDSTFQSLEKGKIDGEENTLSNIYSKKFYNLQKHLTISNHGYLGYVVLMDQHFWDQQTDYTKKILTEAMEEASLWNQQQAEKMNKEQLKLIQKTSTIQIHELTKRERQHWVDKLNPLYEKLSPVLGKDLVKELVKLREEYE